MESTVVYLSAIDTSESQNPNQESERILKVDPPILGDVVEMDGERIWKVIYIESYRPTVGPSIYVAVVSPVDAQGIGDPENWWPVASKRDYPEMCFSINITPDKSVINYEWNMSGERTTKRIWGVVENSDGAIVRKNTDWEINRVETFEPQLDQSFPLFNRIYLCHATQVFPVRELVTAS